MSEIRLPYEGWQLRFVVESIQNKITEAERHQCDGTQIAKPQNQQFLLPAQFLIRTAYGLFADVDDAGRLSVFTQFSSWQIHLERWMIPRTFVVSADSLYPNQNCSNGAGLLSELAPFQPLRKDCYGRICT